MWEMTSFVLGCLHFSTLSHVSAAVKRMIVLQALISVKADIRLWIITVKEKRRLSVNGYNICVCAL